MQETIVSSEITVRIQGGMQRLLFDNGRKMNTLFFQCTFVGGMWNSAPFKTATGKGECVVAVSPTIGNDEIRNHFNPSSDHKSPDWVPSMHVSAIAQRPNHNVPCVRVSRLSLLIL